MRAKTTVGTARVTAWGITEKSNASLHIRYPPGELIYQAGSYAAGICLIVYGLVSDRQAVPITGHRSCVPEILGPGDLIGLDTLLESSANVHLTSARAITEVALCFFERDDFNKILREQPAVRERYLEYLNNRFHALKKHSCLSIFASSEARLCSMLLDLARRFGERQDAGDVLLPNGISTDRLPELLGLSRRCVKRILADLPDVRHVEDRLVVSVESLQRRLVGD